MVMFLISHTMDITLFLLLITIFPLAKSFSFDFPNFDPNNDNIIYERSAYPGADSIQLTMNARDKPMAASIGRAAYSKPFHLWDKSSGKLTDFTTHFSFSIDSMNNSLYGDGLALFLAPAGSKIPRNATKGGGLGLASDFHLLNSSQDDPFVAVEFDIHMNPWDVSVKHVGIDISSISSVKAKIWNTIIEKGSVNEAWIAYNSSSFNLSVLYTSYENLNQSYFFNESLWYIVDLREHLPEWVTIGFSGATGYRYALHTIYSWRFCARDFEVDVSSHNPSRWIKPSLPIIGLVVGLAIGMCILGCGFGFIWFLFFKKRNQEDDGDGGVLDEYMNDEFLKGTGPKKFSYGELVAATSNFNGELKLGQGGFGFVYKGLLRGHDLGSSSVAVKKVSSWSRQGIKEYASEVKIISRLRHRNLVQLIGWCHKKRELMLVYEFMPNGSLDSHLFKERSLLNCDKRYKIAHGLASALLYLHEECEQCVLHRDVKPSNIMLDSSFNAKLGDFGLARLVDHSKGSQNTVLAGTLGYLAPECATTGKCSKKTDVYSFGVVVLEIVSGRRAMSFQEDEDEDMIVEWIWELYGRGKLHEAVDPKLFGRFDEQQMERLVIVGLWCAHPDSNLRPSIRQAISVLNLEAALPVLPSRMPIATYFVPLMKPNGFSVPMFYYETQSEEGLGQNQHSNNMVFL